jgi:hypothetical protein
MAPRVGRLKNNLLLFQRKSTPVRLHEPGVLALRVDLPWQSEIKGRMRRSPARTSPVILRRHRPIICLVVIASADSVKTFAAASRTLILALAVGFFALISALADFLAAGFFVAAVFVVFFADMVILQVVAFRSAARRVSADHRRRDRTP